MNKAFASAGDMTEKTVSFTEVRSELILMKKASLFWV